MFVFPHFITFWSDNMTRYLIAILLTLSILGCETQSTAIDPATHGSAGGSKGGAKIATTTRLKHPLNPNNVFTPCNASVDGVTYASTWSQNASGVEIACFGSDGVCFTVSNCTSVVINESSGGPGGMGGTGYNVLEGPP